VTPAILFLTGASGSGKTTLVTSLRTGDPEGVYLHFDAIGVPDDETMVREHGSGERWQAEMTRRWIATIVEEHPTRPLVVLEGQVRPIFVETALIEYEVSRSAIVLVHCDDDEREARLVRRGQPELANESMRSWAAFLRRDAQARQLATIDSTNMPIADMASALLDVARHLLRP
jgi:dephospho-CoA kinase